jgi:hypothetical protein
LQRPGFARVFRSVQLLAGVILAWFFFYLIGQGLLSLPSSFHEGTLWHIKWLDEN